MVRSPRRADRRARPGACALPARCVARARAPARRALAAVDDHALRQHDRARGAAAVPRRPRARAAARGLDALERARDGDARQPRRERRLGRARRPHRELRVGGRPVRGRLQPFLPRPRRRDPAGRPARRSHDSRRPGAAGLSRRSRLLPAALGAGRVRTRLSRRSSERRRPRALPPGADRAGARCARPHVVSAPAADAGLLAVPDRLDGNRPDQRDLPGALHPLSAAPQPPARGERPGAAARLGLLRRRRDGRARIDRRADARRARAARQLHLRHQLQPAAPRRAGARQRPDRRRARVGVRRRRLARDQVPVELRLGRAVRARPRSCADARVRAYGRRPVPDAFGQGRRVQPRGLLRPERRAQGARRRPARRGHRSPAPRRPRRRQDPRRVRRRDRARGAADRRSRQDDEGLRHGRGGAGPDDDAPGEEARQRRPARVPRPLRAADERRRHAVARVLQAGRRQRRDPLPAKPAARARRPAAGAAKRVPEARRACARRDRGVRAPRRRQGNEHDDGLRAHARQSDEGSGDRPARRSHRRRRGAHLRHGEPVPPVRHLRAARPALPARGLGIDPLVPRGQERPDPRGRHHRGRRALVVDGGGDVVLDARAERCCRSTSTTRCSASSASAT